MFFVGSGYGFWIHPIFYTEPDPGKLYGFHGSGSATLTTRIIMTKSLTSHRFATRWMVLSPVARPGRQDTELPHLGGNIHNHQLYITVQISVAEPSPSPSAPDHGQGSRAGVFGWIQGIWLEPDPEPSKLWPRSGSSFHGNLMIQANCPYKLHYLPV